MAQDWALFTETVTHARLGWTEGESARRLAALLRQQVTPQTLAAFDDAARTVDVTALLPQVRTPTLVLHRRQLTHPQVESARTLAAGIPGAYLVLLDGESLAPFLGDTAAVNRAIAFFLTGDRLPPTMAPATSGPMLLPEPLSEREYAVLRYLADGLSNQAIADTLFVSVGTVKSHLNSIYQKLGVHSRTQAVAQARAAHLLD